MRAITQHRYGGTETLQLTEIDTPTPGPGEVLVRVRAAGVDRGTWHLMAGRPYAVRLAVGSYAVQVAAALGAEVTGVASGAKADLVRSLGATDVIDHTREEIDESGRRWDVIIDLAGLRRLSLLRRCLAPDGTLVIAGGEGGDRWLGGTHRQLGAMALSPFVRQHLTSLLSKETAAGFATLADMADRGELRPVLERTYALEEAAKAIDHLVDGHVRGKIVVAP